MAVSIYEHVVFSLVAILIIVQEFGAHLAEAEAKTGCM